jgi:glycosyltransferase involved in cell wall biosynthesis
MSTKPLRILMYTAYMPPEYSGASRQALTLAKVLRSRGHRIEFITNRWPGLDAQANIEGFLVHRLSLGGGRKHRELRLWLNMARFVWTRRRDFDILHSHGAYYANAFIGPLAKLFGMKSVIKASLADNDLQGLGRSLIGTAHRAMLRHVHACVGISQDLVREFTAGGIPSTRVHYVPNGVDTARFTPGADCLNDRRIQTLAAPSRRPLVLYVGVLDQRKNVVWLAEQWLANRGFGTGARLLVVGPQGRDDPRAEVLGRLRSLATVHPDLLEVRDYHADVTSFYQAADVLVLPSMKEGMPNVVLEAMACGLPCVVARTSGSRELIEEGVNGFTYAPGDARELGDAVLRCLSSAGREMGERARVMAIQSYDIERVTTQYEAIYAMITGRRRRVVYVENGIGYGGAIICLRHLVRNLDRQVYEPLVITGFGDERYQDIANEASWRHIPDRRVDIISMKRALQAAVWPDRVPGLRWVANQGLARLDDMANFLPSFAQTLWTMLRFRPDLVHVNNEPLCNRAAVLAGKLLGVPVISHVRGDQQGSLMMHPFFRLPDYFIAVSRWVSDSIGRIGVPEGKRTYIYDGIELDKLDTQADGRSFRRRHGVRADSFAVGLVGLLIPWKGQRLFLEAAERIAAAHPDIDFVIVGSAPDEFKAFEAELREFAQRPSLAGRVIFTGHVSEMAAAYNALDVVVSASTSPEPLGTMIIEAMTMARPIVAPNHGGALEMVEDRRTGLLFEAGDALDLTEKIITLHGDRELATKLGRQARAQALQTFAIKEHVRRVQAVYDQILAPRSDEGQR